MQKYSEFEKYFLLKEFEEGWGMEEIVCEEQLLDYCIEVLYIPNDKIEELIMDDNYNLEITLEDVDENDISEDWYINLKRMSKVKY